MKKLLTALFAIGTMFLVSSKAMAQSHTHYQKGANSQSEIKYLSGYMKLNKELRIHTVLGTCELMRDSFQALKVGSKLEVNTIELDFKKVDEYDIARKYFGKSYGALAGHEQSAALQESWRLNNSARRSAEQNGRYRITLYDSNAVYHVLSCHSVQSVGDLSRQLGSNATLWEEIY
jgi:hypothetical protein